MYVFQGTLFSRNLALVPAFNRSNRKYSDIGVEVHRLRIVPLLERGRLFCPLTHNIWVLVYLISIRRHHIVIRDNHIEYIRWTILIGFVLRIIKGWIGLLVLLSRPDVGSVEWINIWLWTHNIHE